MNAVYIHCPCHRKTNVIHSTFGVTQDTSCKYIMAFIISTVAKSNRLSVNGIWSMLGWLQLCCVYCHRIRNEVRASKCEAGPARTASNRFKRLATKAGAHAEHTAQWWRQTGMLQTNTSTIIHIDHSHSGHITLWHNDLLWHLKS